MVKFKIDEKLYSRITFEIDCDEKEAVDAALDEIGDCVSADVLYNHLTNVFGCEKVKVEGLNDSDNVDSMGEYEFYDWIED